MTKQGGSFFSEHIEKIVLPVIGLFCLWLLIARVLISPNYIEYKGKKFGPNQIDDYIEKQADTLQARMSIKPEPKELPKTQFEKFNALADSTLKIDPKLILPIPDYVREDVISDSRYGVPVIGSVSDVKVEHIRAVAYVPTNKVDSESPYDSAETEPNDIDFVTVSANFDVVALYESFYENFAGDSVRVDWRDPCRARPVFAAVNLQRQELLDDGSWSAWKDIPRTRIDHQSKMLEIIEEVNELPLGGMGVRLLQFDNPEVTMNILQPRAYEIASAEEEWFPPELHREFLKYKKLERDVERREALEAKIREKELKDREKARSSRDRRSRPERRTPRTTVRDREDGGGGGDDEGFGGIGGGRTIGRRATRDRQIPGRNERDRRERIRDEGSISDVYSKFEELLFDENSDFSRLNEEILVWAHDDTVQPNRTYQYRVRLGVLNPLAGTDKFSAADKKYKDKVILWSDFSEASDTLEIPARLYFFPTDIQQAANTVRVEVFKYVLGYWYSDEFSVAEGELIGGIVPYIPTEEEEGKDLKIPESINYDSGAVLVDTIMVKDWAGGRILYPREYFDMYYSFDGTSLENIPISQRYWASDVRNRYIEIKNLMKKPKEALRSWGGRATKARYRPLRRDISGRDEFLMEIEKDL